MTIDRFVNKLLLVRLRRKINPGYTYEEILEKVHKKFPEAKTTLNNLRFYASMAKKGGVKLPERPRKKKGAKLPKKLKK